MWNTFSLEYFNYFTPLKCQSNAFIWCWWSTYNNNFYSYSIYYLHLLHYLDLWRKLNWMEYHQYTLFYSINASSTINRICDNECNFFVCPFSDNSYLNPIRIQIIDMNSLLSINLVSNEMKSTVFIHLIPSFTKKFSFIGVEWFEDQ